MKNLKIAALCAIFGLQAGCVANDAKDSMKHAVLIQPSAATTQVLNGAVSRALNGTKVMLARDVLTQSSELKIERMAQDTALTQGLNGGLMGTPQVYRFLLKMDASGGCYLIYQKNGQKYPLDGVSCRAL